MMKLSLLLLLAAALGLAPVPRRDAPATRDVQDPPAGPAQERENPIKGDEITPEQRRAVERGFEFLVSRQQPDGSFGSMGLAGSGTAVTSLSAIALMSGGHLPGRGRYGEEVTRAVDYVMASAQPSGLLSATDDRHVMYAHGFATLFLAEVYGMTADDRVKEPLVRAVQLIQKTQNDEGGWRYTPAPYDADISVTICQVMALRAARDAGIKVEKQVIDDAVKYVQDLQNPDGGFNYQAGRGSNSAFARSAAGVAVLYYAGHGEGEPVESGLDYLQRHTPGAGGPEVASHYFYGHYYAVQAMFLAGGEYWRGWYPAVRDELVGSQEPDGSWANEPGLGPEYCTAMSLIVLQMPNRYLPVFSGKGPGA